MNPMLGEELNIKKNEEFPRNQFPSDDRHC